MHLMLILAQAAMKAPPPPASSSFEAGQLIGQGCGLLIMLAMTIGGVYVIKNWPSQRGGRLPIGALLVTLPWIGGLLGVFVAVTGSDLPMEAILIVPAGWLLWFGLYIFARLAIRREEKYFAAQPAVAPPRRVPTNQPYSGRPDAYQGPRQQSQDVDPEVADEPEQVPRAAKTADRAQVSPDTPVIARCGSCMGRWKTTAGEAKALQACPKCGVSPPQLRLQRA